MPAVGARRRALSRIRALGNLAVEAGVEGAVVVPAVFAGEGAAGCPVKLPRCGVVGAGNAWGVFNGTCAALGSVHPGSALAHCARGAAGGGGAVVVSGAYCTRVIGGIEECVTIACEVAFAAVGDGSRCRLIGARYTH